MSVSCSIVCSIGPGDVAVSCSYMRESPSYIARMARECLCWLNDNECEFIVLFAVVRFSQSVHMTVESYKRAWQGCTLHE